METRRDFPPPIGPENETREEDDFALYLGERARGEGQETRVSARVTLNGAPMRGQFWWTSDDPGDAWHKGGPFEAGHFEVHLPRGRHWLHLRVLSVDRLAMHPRYRSNWNEARREILCEGPELAFDCNLQVAVQTVRGRVVAIGTGEAQAGQYVSLADSESVIGGVACDEQGRFLTEVPIGVGAARAWVDLGPVRFPSRPDATEGLLIEIPGFTAGEFTIWHPAGNRLNGRPTVFWRLDRDPGAGWAPANFQSVPQGDSGQGAQLACKVPNLPATLHIQVPNPELGPLRIAWPPKAGPSPQYTLPFGGTALLRCTQRPDTGVIVDGPDPTPILVVESHLPAAGSAPNAASWLELPAVREALPREAWYARRVEFNRRGEAEVSGLPPGTYTLVHWRDSAEVPWPTVVFQIRAGETTESY
ncbi:MAG: hypothetical protein R3F17_09645 [Planctomycetota bacterium]